MLHCKLQWVPGLHGRVKVSIECMSLRQRWRQQCMVEHLVLYTLLLAHKPQSRQLNTTVSSASLRLYYQRPRALTWAC